MRKKLREERGELLIAAGASLDQAKMTCAGLLHGSPSPYPCRHFPASAIHNLERILLAGSRISTPPSHVGLSASEPSPTSVRSKPRKPS